MRHFFSKNTRIEFYKGAKIKDIYDIFKDNMASSIKGTYGDYSYFIVWRAYEGIHSFVFNKEGELVNDKWCDYKDAKDMEYSAIRYIKRITKQLKKLENNK